jgi:predicted phosphodiesterase
MQVACLYDVHGNVPALRAVLADPAFTGASHVLVGGDAVSGPYPAETLELLLGIGPRARFIRGNADRELEPWVAERLSEDARAVVRGWPATAALDVPELGSVCFCHGSPRSDTEIITTASPEARVRPMLEGVDEPTIVCGHTHVQFDRRVGARRIVNAGSVGMPYQGEAGAAFWSLLGPDVELRRTSYDAGLLAAALAESGFPDPDWFEPASAEEATAHFEAMAGG